ncbi:SUMF1/EgtB/PvdO family nonheme iron enzyme [bacterium]|nr:SUMF1/EgtB/PvdO family nonheme iron enzyme [bacterium]
MLRGSSLCSYKRNLETTHNLGRMLCAGVFVALLALTMVLPIYANNIQVNSVTVIPSGSYAYVQFNLSWDNSWKDSTNWDAAWVFVKYRKTDDTSWNHAYLNTTAGNHTIPESYECSVGDTGGNGMGVFIYRDSVSSGSVSLTGVQLRWDYSDNGLSSTDTVTVKVFAIEMVYIPTGSFYIGDGNGTTESAYAFHTGTGNSAVEVIDSLVNDIRVDANSYDDNQLETAGIGIDGDGGIDTNDDGSIDNANFPTGYTAFYCMKYEISQGQYADFLNTLTATQDSTRYYSTSSNRYTIGGSAGSRSASVPDRACNFLSWMDDAAYADWAGLRPMTELEFEKICRGPKNAVSGEFAWGNANIANFGYTLSDDGQPTATVSNAASDPTGNASYSTTTGSINGPLRCGIFADSDSTRAEAGDSYYGVMEMSGNLWERPVTLGNGDGRSFEGSHGDGALSTNGNATNSDWPGESGGEVTGALGAGFRGGYWVGGTSYLCVSDRSVAAGPDADRNHHFGFRCVRSAP